MPQPAAPEPDLAAGTRESPTPEAGLAAESSEPSLAAPLSPSHALLLQRAAGNTAVSRLLIARQPPPVQAPPQIAPFGWRDPELGRRVEGTDPASRIATYLAGLNPQQREQAVADLQGARTQLLGQRMGAPVDLRRRLGERTQRIDVTLHAHYRDIAVAAAPGQTAPAGGWAAGSRPAGLTSGTHTPTQAERDRLRDAMTPQRRRTGSGALAPFRSVIPTASEAYEQRIYRSLHAQIDRLNTELVQGKGPAEHAVAANLNPWSRYEQIADLAKEETDRVFGSYTTGPAFRHGPGVHGGNLRDRFEEEQADQRRLGRRGRRQQAEQLVEYFLQSSRAIELINEEHDAIPERTTLSPGERRSEAQILRGAVRTIAAAREQTLLDVDRGWEGTAFAGVVSLQRWRQPTPELQRRHFWDSFQTMIHEYLHTLTHPRYDRYARSLPGGDAGLAYNTLIEGMTSAMTEIVWVNVAPRVGDPSISQRVEGSDYVDAASSRAACPEIPSRYPSYHQAMEIISTVGPRNVFAAYLLGEVDLIRASTP